MADMHLADTLVLCVTFLNYVVCENGNAINQCNFQDDYCVNVSSCAPILKFFCAPRIFLKGKYIYEKLPILTYLGQHTHISELTTVKFGVVEDLRLPCVCQIL